MLILASILIHHVSVVPVPLTLPPLGNMWAAHVILTQWAIFVLFKICSPIFFRPPPIFFFHFCFLAFLNYECFIHTNTILSWSRSTFQILVNFFLISGCFMPFSVLFQIVADFGFAIPCLSDCTSSPCSAPMHAAVHGWSKARRKTTIASMLWNVPTLQRIQQNHSCT